jgi:hypothetical protein
MIKHDYDDPLLVPQPANSAGAKPSGRQRWHFPNLRKIAPIVDYVQLVES